MDIIAKKQEKLQNLIESARKFDDYTDAAKNAVEVLANFCFNDFGDKSLNAIAKQYARRAALALKALSGKMRNVNGGND